jgi:predicted flavoprotein YhiN
MRVDLFDAMPSVGRKFLLAGKGGLNLTHSEPFEPFVDALRRGAHLAAPAAASAFGPQALRDWAATAGHRDLRRQLGPRLSDRHEGRAAAARLAAPAARAGRALSHAPPLAGWAATTAPCFDTPAGEHCSTGRRHRAGAGRRQLAAPGLRRRLGAVLTARGVDVAPLQPSNCGFDVGWSEHLERPCAAASGQPLKSVAAFTGADGHPHRSAASSCSPPPASKAA